jgi:hypothetical protein
MEMLGDGTRADVSRFAGVGVTPQRFAILRTAPNGAFSPAGPFPISSVDLIAGVC